MSSALEREIPVLIIGAGPTGLVLALWMARLGVRVRIIDKTKEAGTTSRALAVQARTLEFYQQIGLAEEVVERGQRFTTVNLWAGGKKRGHSAVFGDLGKGLSPFPYGLIFPQDEHERLLIDRLADAGVQVERGTELLRLEEATDHLVARLKRRDGTEEACRATYLAGCDGAHSTVREALGIGFVGGTYQHLFYIADVEASGEAINGELHVDTADFLAVFPLKGEGSARLIGTLRQEAERENEKLSWDDVSKQAIDWMRIEVRKVNWFSTYHVHHRVAGQFRRGRTFLLGDAAHIHSPVGGQGMNTGIGDAVNLAWKLSAVLDGRATGAILDSYEPERIGFARRLVASTDRVFTLVISRGLIARLVRLDIVPFVVPRLFQINTFRRFLYRTTSQIAINYRGSPLSVGEDGKIRGGDRLPWVPLGRDGVADNFAPLTAMEWQAHVYGEPTTELAAICRRRNLPLHLFRWETAIGRAGLMRNALYLVRPDGHVAFADSLARPSELTTYLDRWDIRIPITDKCGAA